MRTRRAGHAVSLPKLDDVNVGILSDVADVPVGMSCRVRWPDPSRQTAPARVWPGFAWALCRVCRPAGSLTRPLLLELCVNARAVDVVVRDGDPTVPAARAADPDRIGRHGLEIVKAVTEALLTEQEPGGKHVTARSALLDGPGGHVTSRRP